MSKIICDICGTTYPETAECCPICGCSRESADEFMTDDLLEEDTKSKTGRFVGKKKEIFDFDEVNSEDEEEDYDEEDEEEDYDEEEEEEAPRHNTVLVILLTILIAGLLIAAGFIFVRYFLPNMKNDDAVLPQNTTAAVASAEMEETGEPTIPCETLIIGSGTVAELNAEGQHFLLHIKAMPENTTDKIIYTSADESIATVTEDGRITAVSEGETTIYISCGKSSIECPVIIKYVEETVPPTTEAVTVETTEPATIPVVEAVDPDAPESVKTDVVLKLKKTDIRLGVYYQFTLELDCDLEQNEVQWSSEHPHIATVDENGVVTAVKSGTTAITAKYGDQEVSCIVRCG